MHKPLFSMEMDEYEVEQKQSLCYRTLCCWNFKKFHSDGPPEKSKRDSDIFYRRFSDLQQQHPMEPEDNDAELVYDEDIFYTDGTLMLGDSAPLKFNEDKLSPQGRIDDSSEEEVDLGVGYQVAYRVNKKVDEGVQTDAPFEEDPDSPHNCARCLRINEALMADDHWFGDDNRNICQMESVTSSATWWTTADSITETNECQHRLRTAKSESDTRAILNANSKLSTALDGIDNHATRNGRVKSDGAAYGYKFCWDNLTSSDNETDVQSPDSSFAGMHDFEEGSMEMESPFLDSNESLLSAEMMARCEFESPAGSSYRDNLENKNNRQQDIFFHNKDQSWRLEREKGRRKDNLLELLAKDDLSDEDNVLG